MKYDLKEKSKFLIHYAKFLKKKNVKMCFNIRTVFLEPVWNLPTPLSPPVLDEDERS